MPHVHNGIGTWYAGKRNVVTRKGTCTLCGAYADMRSYDTTLYIVVFMIPLVPLKKVHVIDDCPSCQRHRTIKQREWDTIKAEGIQKALEEVQAKPGDRETALKAVGTAVSLQDDEAFLGLSALLEETSAHDPIALAALAEGYAYFNHNAPAEAALRKSLSLNPAPPDDLVIRESLGHHLLMHGDADEGVSLLSHILDQRDAAKSHLLVLGVEAYRAAGRHPDALALLDRIEAAFPALSTDKRVKALRKSSTKLASSNKPIKVAYIHPKDAKAGAENGWLSGIPRFVGPTIALGAVAWYLIAAWWIGEHRLIHVVNGTSRGYTAEIAGIGISVPPGSHTTMRIPEGVVTIRISGTNTHVPETTARVQTNFWGRPFTSPVVVVNPDRIALVEWEQTEYLPPNTPKIGRHNYALHIGHLVHIYDDIDYPFQAFPPSLKVSSKSGSQVKHRVDLLPMPDPIERLRTVAMQSGPEAIQDFALRAVLADPGAGDYAEALMASKDKPATIAALKPLLADRPVRISVHRAYQELLRTSDLDAVLAEYRDLLAKEPANASMKYLLARLEEKDRAKATALWRESLADPQAGSFSASALAFDFLSDARFEDALAVIAKAPAGSENDDRLNHLKSVALHGLGRFDEILKLPDMAQPVEEMHLSDAEDYLYFKQRAQTVASGREEGRKAAAAIVDDFCASYGSDPDQADLVKQFRATFAARIAYVDGDDAPEAALAGGPSGGFESNLCKGDLAAAEKYVDEARAFGAASGPLLLAIAATLKGDDAIASAQFEAAAKLFENTTNGRRICTDWFRSTKTPAAGEAADLNMEVHEKAITLVALGLKFPERRDECFAVARKLNFDRRSPHLLLAKAMDSTSKP